MFFFAVDVGLVLAPKYLEEVQRLTVNEIGWLGTWAAIGMMVLVYTLSKLRGEGVRPLLIGLGLSITGLLLLRFGGNNLTLLAIAFFINGGNRLIRPPMLVRVGRLLAPQTLSFGLGIQQTATQLGLAVSPYVAGLLYAQQPVWPFYGGLASVGVMLLVMILIFLSETAASRVQPSEQAVD